MPGGGGKTAMAVRGGQPVRFAAACWASAGRSVCPSASPGIPHHHHHHHHHQGRCCGGIGASSGTGRRAAAIIGRAAADKGKGFSFEETEEYVEAQIHHVKHTDKYGHVIYLKLKDSHGSVLPVYIGDFECAALVKEMNKKPSVRPMTHDLMKNCLDLLGYKVSKVRITALVGNTYHARVHFLRKPLVPGDPLEDEVDVDARPSDAINLALRFNAPVYVNKSIATRMAHSARSNGSENRNDVVRSCREEIKHHADPTVMLKLQLEMAVAEERYEDATRLRDEIEQMLSTDRVLALVVALESALEGKRYEEAIPLRNELRRLREAGTEATQTQTKSDS